MSKRLVCAFAGAALTGLSALSGTAAADVISLRADEWCPYNCAPDSAQPGYMIEVAKRVFEAAGHSVDYQVLNWARAIDETRQGKFVGIVGAATGDAEDFVFPAQELGMSANGYAARKTDGWTYTGIASLESRSLGVIRDYSYSDDLDAYIEANKKDSKRIQVSSGDNALELSLRKLQKGRLDTVVDGQYVLEYTLAQLQLDNELHIAGTDTDADAVYIAFSPANPKSKEYADLLAKGIVALRTSGELKAILARYGLTDWR